jgi:hypothetical protein
MGEIKNRIMGFCKEIIEDSKNYGIYNIEYNFKIYNSTLVIDAKNIGTKNSYSVATITSPPATDRETSAFTAPSRTSLTVPANTLRALIAI